MTSIDALSKRLDTMLSKVGTAPDAEAERLCRDVAKESLHAKLALLQDGKLPDDFDEQVARINHTYLSDDLRQLSDKQLKTFKGGLEGARDALLTRLAQMNIHTTKEEEHGNIPAN